MPKVTANGKTFNFPEGTTDEQISQAVDEYFAGSAQAPEEPSALKQAMGGVADMIEQGTQGLDFNLLRNQGDLPQQKPEIKAPVLPFGMTQSDIDAANKRRVDKNKLIERIVTDPQALAAYRMAQKEGTGAAIGESALSELSGLSTGVSELIDKYLPEELSNVLNYRIGGKNFDTPEQRMEERAIQRGKERLVQGARDIASPVASVVGKTVPYLASDIALSPITNAILSTTGKGITRVGKTALRGAEGLESGLRKGGSAISQQAADIVDPLVVSMQNIANRPVMSPELAASYKELARAPLTGAIEGGAHYDMTAEQGAGQSLLGQFAAMGPAKAMLGRMPSKLSESEKQTLKTLERRGYRATPGMKTGSKVLQAKEQGFRSEARFRDYMDEFDTANQKVIADYASEAMGLPKQTSADLTPEVLSGHMQNLRNQYQQLEANTTGKFSQDSFKKINGILKNLQPLKDRNQSQAAKQRYATVLDAVNEMRTVLQPFRTKDGKFEKQVFDGSRYQAASQYLNDQISSAFQNGDKILARNLKTIKEELDKSIESGMGKSRAKDWRDLNERYAMTRLVMENGMDPLGGINTNKLTQHLMSGDEAVRTLTSKGGRIKKLQDIAKIDTMQRRQAGAEGYSGSNVDLGDTSRKGLLRSVLTTPLTAMIPTSTRAGMNLYMSGYPAVTGLTGLPKPAIGKISRAQEQGSQKITRAAEWVRDKSMSDYEWLKKLIED